MERRMMPTMRRIRRWNKGGGEERKSRKIDTAQEERETMLLQGYDYCMPSELIHAGHSSGLLQCFLK